MEVRHGKPVTLKVPATLDSPSVLRVTGQTLANAHSSPPAGGSAVLFCSNPVHRRQACRGQAGSRRIQMGSRDGILPPGPLRRAGGRGQEIRIPGSLRDGVDCFVTAASAQVQRLRDTSNEMGSERPDFGVAERLSPEASGACAPSSAAPAESRMNSAGSNQPSRLVAVGFLRHEVGPRDRKSLICG
jgi:hypothetical protein